MKVIGINGSPRKRWNSAMVLDRALAGAASVGAEVKRIDLFALQFSGCVSCFACKCLNGASYTRCALHDALTPVLEEILQCNVLIIAAPVYYGQVPGTVRNFYERLLFPANHYISDPDTDEGYGFRMRVGLIYTMNSKKPENNRNPVEVDRIFFQRSIGDTKTMNVLNTFQFDDYSKYASSRFDLDEKKKQRELIFPEDCKKAFEMGARLVGSY